MYWLPSLSFHMGYPKRFKRKIIYLQYRQSDVTTKWINENTIQNQQYKMDQSKSLLRKARPVQLKIKQYQMQKVKPGG